MATTHTTRNRLEKQGAGENDATWGTRLNERTTDMIDEAMDGYDLTNIAGTGDYTLSANNGLTDESRNRYLDLTGTLTGNRNVIVPTAERWWFIRNGTDGAFTVTIKTSGGTGITIEQGKSAILFCDGTNVEYLLPGQGWGAEQAATASGTDTYTATLTPAPLAYFDGMQVDLIFTNANTAASTINLNSLGAVAIERRGSSIVAGVIPANGRVSLSYDGTAFQMEAIRIEVSDLLDEIDTAQLANNAVTTAKITDANVTGPKIAMGSDAQGDIIFRGAANYERLGAGTAGDTLQSGGAGADPSWVAPTSNRVVLYTSTTSTPVAEIDVANGDLDWTAYDIYEIEYRNITVVNDDVELFLRVYDTTTAIWQAGSSNYDVAGHDSTSGVHTGMGGTQRAQIEIMRDVAAGDGVGNAPAESADVSLKIIDPSNTTFYKKMFFNCHWIDSVGDLGTSRGSGLYRGTTNAISGIRLFAELGNIDGCDLTVYGIKTA